MNTLISSKTVTANGLQLHYLEAGAGPPVLLLHGWPTSSFVWRKVMPGIARRNRVIALDLPGFGRSDKPLDVTYNFDFHLQTLDAFFDAVGVKTLGLTVHDLGGPIGLYWAVKRRARVAKLALLNTIVYPQFSWAVVAFVMACRLPVIRSLMASPEGLWFAMRIGIRNRKNLTDEVLQGVKAPFASKQARQALLKTAYELNRGGFFKIEKALPEFKIPVRVIYGEGDRILPDVAKTMQKVKRDLPQAVVSSLPGCGHFLQEEFPEEIGRMLGEFFGG